MYATYVYIYDVCIIYVHICYRISEHTSSFPIYAVTYINIREYICAQKFSIYLPCDIYVSIYVNKYGLKKSTCICLMSYMLLYNVRLPMLLHIMTFMNVSCLCVSIYVLKKVYVNIYVNIYGLKKPHIFCIVSYVSLYNFRLPVCCHIDLYECRFFYM